MTTDVEALQQLLQTGLVNAVVSVFTCVGVFVFLVVLSPPLALAAAAGAAAAGRSRRGGTAGASSAPTSRPASASPTVNANLQESLSGVRVGPGLRPRGPQHRRLPRRQRRVPRRPARRPAADRPVLPVRAAARRPRRRGRARRGAALVADGAVTAGVVIAFLLYLDQFFSPIQQLSQVFDTWQQAGGVDGQDRRADGHADRHARRRRARSTAGRLRGEIALRGRATSATPTPAGAEALAGVDLDDRAGRDGGARRRDRRRQVDDREAGRPLLRPDRRAGVASTASTCATSTSARTAASSASCPRRRSCSPARSATTSPTAGPTPPTPRSRRRPGPSAPTTFIAAPARRLPHRGHRAGPQPVGGPAPAHRPGPGPARRPGDPAARRGDLEPRPGHRGAGAAGDGRRSPRGRTTILVAHRLPTARTADRIVVVDDGRDRRGGHPRRAARARRPLRRALAQLRVITGRRRQRPGPEWPRDRRRGAVQLEQGAGAAGAAEPQAGADLGEGAATRRAGGTTRPVRQ